ncbi:MAG: isoprenylcysteine carboxylmethyltransferase family protein [Verrucomicrobia bacterium]|nr:isoprenylcysteine carboxylmethyltransferase family protein [Verrucomicrobiota bacterium]
MTAHESTVPRRSILRRLGGLVLKVLGFFVILEPVWMLLPFAGFLYGSVLQIESLNQNPRTAWLTHFVFPVLTGGWLGPVLVAIGFLIFCVGAGQIYWSKLRRAGLVTNGLYRFVRHPQYIALTLFGLGILLTWGRAITFIAFFVMMFLYYYLAKNEEQACVRLFGENYGRYRERTSFIVPGDRALRRLRGTLPTLRLAAPLRVTAAFVATMAVCVGLMGLIDAVKVRLRRVPFLVATVQLGPAEKPPDLPALAAGKVGDVPFVQSERILVARGPYRNAWASGFAETLLCRLRQSAALKNFLGFLDEPGNHDVLFVFSGPFEQPAQPGAAGTPGMFQGGGPDGRGPAPDPHGPDRVRLILMRCALADGATMPDALADKSKRRIVRGCIAPVNIARPDREDLVEGNVALPGPGFPGEARWDMFLRQFAAQPTEARQVPAVTTPGASGTGTLVVVQAPILRTRLDPDFAVGIRDRLLDSAMFRDRLRRSGVGGPVVAVAFPRPGPNWYREHHGTPQVSVFVILARLRPGSEPGDLFYPSRRELLGAFIAEMDFKRERPDDAVGEVTVIGPRRDLEERWRFFLSGVGGSDLGAPGSAGVGQVRGG